MVQCANFGDVFSMSGARNVGHSGKDEKRAAFINIRSKPW